MPEAVPDIIPIEGNPNEAIWQGLRVNPPTGNPDIIPLGDVSGHFDTKSNLNKLWQGESRIPESIRAPDEHSVARTAYDASIEPLVRLPIPHDIEDLQKLGVPVSTTSKVEEGGLRALSDLASGLTSPISIASLGTGAAVRPLAKILGGLFAADMARNMPKQAANLGTAVGEGDTTEAVRQGLGLLGTGLFARAGVKSVMHPNIIPIKSKSALPEEKVQSQPQDILHDVTPTQTSEHTGDIPSTPAQGEVPQGSVREASTPPAQVSMGPAPATFHGRVTSPSGRVLETWNLTQDVEGHPAGSTVSRNTLERLGYEVPEPPKQEAPAASGSKIEPNQEERPMFYNEAGYALEKKFKEGAKVEGQQLHNTLKNSLSPGEFMGLQEAGLGEFLKGKRTAGEVKKWVEENGPKVEVKELPASVKTSATGLEQEEAGLVHQMDTLIPRWRDYVGQEAPPDWPDNARQMFNRYLDIQDNISNGEGINESATARYTMVNPKPLDKMPGAVDLLVRIPQRLSAEQQMRRETDANVKYQSSHYPTEGKNLLAHVRGYMETTPEGKKVFHVFEVQSDWAQAQRAAKEATTVGEASRLGGVRRTELLQKGDPLLKHYERLALKAAIDHARKNGADAVAISDAETAMLTEGHDRAALSQWEGSFDSEGKKTIDIPQEKGMRLHYDRTLPKIMEELTGEKGQKVDFGEHQNAFLDRTISEHQMMTEEEYRDVSEPRTDLIFRNPDGTPKTTITARQYPIAKARKSFSLFGSDKPIKEVPNASRIRSNERPLSKTQGQEGQAEVQSQGSENLRGEMVEQQTPGESKSVGERKVTGESGFIRIPGRSKITRPLNAQADLPDYKPLAQATDAFKDLTRRSIDTPADQAIARWYAERHGVGPAHTSALGAKIHNEVNDQFKADVNGNLNVVPRDPKASLKISDVFEELQRDPNSYQLTPDQRRVFNNVISPVLKQMTKLSTKYDLVDPMDQYFMRGKVTAPDEIMTGVKKPFSGSSVGVKKGFQKERMFASEKEGWEKGYTYETNVESRLIQGVGDMYSAIADKRLAKDPAIGGRSRRQVQADLRKAYPTYSKDQIRKMTDSVMKKGAVMSPAFFGRSFSPEVAKSLNKEFGAEAAQHLRVIASANNIAKAVQLGYDFGAGQVQLLPTFYSRPDIWAKSQVMSIGSFFSPDVFRSYVRNHEQSVRELAEYGSRVGHLEEYMQGGHSISKGARGLSDVIERKVGKLAGNLSRGITEPVAAVTESFNRQFQTSLDVAKIELWEAWRDVTPKEEWGNRIKGIESSLLSGRMESAGVPHSTAIWSRVLFNAPSYYAGSIDFVKSLASSHADGQVVRRAMGKFLLGSIAMYYAVGMRQGMTKEELDERMDPRKSNFMTWRTSNGERPLDVGMGGIFKSYVRLIGNVVKTASEHPDYFKYANSDKNPFTRWLRGHAGPVPSAAWTAAQGKDYLGVDQDMQGIFRNFAPMMTQGKTAKEQALIMEGFNTMPAKSPTAEEVARGMFGADKPIETLNRAQRFQLSKEVEKERYPQTPQEKEQQAQRALEYEFENKKKLKEGLSADNRKFIDANKLELPGYETRESIKGQSLPYTEKEKNFIRGAMIQEYNKTLDRMRSLPGWDKLTQEQKQKRLEALINGKAGFYGAKDRARRELQKARNGKQF